jgi:hypothetical protein
VADPVLPHHRAQDPSIKERFQRDIQVRNALLWRLLGRYQEVRRKDKIIMPPRFKDVCKDFLDSSNPVIEFLQENYEITNNFEDVIPAHVLWASFQRNVKNYTQTMFGRLMEDAGISKSVKKIGEKAVRVYRGLRYQSNDEDSDHE